MNVIDTLKSRYSCRAFGPDTVSREEVLGILDAATRAPSWANTQPWEIYVAGGETLERIRQAYLTNHERQIPGNPDLPRPESWPSILQKRIEQWMAERSQYMGITREDHEARKAMLLANYRLFDAPAVIYLCMDRSLTSWSVFDLGLLAQSIMLAAKHYGLDTIPATMLAMYPEVIRAEIVIPDDLSVIIGIALGHGDLENPANGFRSSRRPQHEVVHLKGL